MESDHVKNRDGEGKVVTLEMVNLWPLTTQIYVRCNLPKFSGKKGPEGSRRVKAPRFLDIGTIW
jgi:hypothetical protein